MTARTVAAVILAHDMIHPCTVVAGNGSRCIEQYRQQVLLDIPDLGGVLLHAVQHETDVLSLQLEKPVFDQQSLEETAFLIVTQQRCL